MFNIIIHALKSSPIVQGQKNIGDGYIFKILKEWGSIENYLAHHDWSTKLKESEIKLQEYKNQGIQFTNYFNEDYPKALRKLKNPPTIIYYYGDLQQLDFTRNISIVGTRKAFQEAKAITRAIVQRLSNYESCIVSGLAYGIDSEAHQSALDYDLPTVAILGSGLLEFHYKTKQLEIFKSMQTNPRNLIISEFEPHDPAQSWTFAHRNRIIAALSPVTIVMEAPLGSGSLITAEAAYLLNHQVLTFPGKIHDVNYQGNNLLLKENKAQALYSVDDVLQYIKLETKITKAITETPNTSNQVSKQILEFIKLEPVSFDYLINQSGLDTSSLSYQLSLMEIQGLIKKSAGMKYTQV